MHSTHDEVDLTLSVLGKETVAEEISLLTLGRADGLDLPPWVPGCHVDLVVGDGLTRQYSLCGDPAVRGVWQVAVQRDRGSRGGSTYVHDVLERGDCLEAHGPRNNFPLIDAARYLFLAGGIGIAPLVPMIRAAQASGADWHLVYGGRTRSTMAFADQLVAAHPARVRLVPQDVDGLLPLADVLDEQEPGTLVYCCGPEGLIEAAERDTGARPALALQVERFSARTAPEPAVSGRFEVELARSGAVIEVPDGTTVLDAVLDQGVFVPQSCTEGICGTCEVSVLAGRPDHRDSLLTDAERAQNETMFICVSRSLSERLVLDI